MLNEHKVAQPLDTIFKILISLITFLGLCFAWRGGTLEIIQILKVYLGTILTNLIWISDLRRGF